MQIALEDKTKTRKRQPFDKGSKWKWANRHVKQLEQNEMLGDV